MVSSLQDALRRRTGAEPAADDGPEDTEGTDRAEAPTGRLDPVR